MYKSLKPHYNGVFYAFAVRHFDPLWQITKRFIFLRFFIPVLVILGISVLLNNLNLKIGLIFGGIALLVILPGFYIYAYINRKYYNKYKDIYNELNKLFLTKMSGVVADDKDVVGS